MEIGALKRDAAKAEAGQWVSDIPNMGDLRLRVRGLSSPTVVALRSRKERKATRDERERDNSLKPEVALRILGEVLHEAVLLDWDGLTENGKPLVYDPELAKQWLTDPDFMLFTDAVTWASTVVDKGNGDGQAALEKNSPRSPAGKSSGAVEPAT